MEIKLDVVKAQNALVKLNSHRMSLLEDLEKIKFQLNELLSDFSSKNNKLINEKIDLLTNKFKKIKINLCNNRLVIEKNIKIYIDTSKQISAKIKLLNEINVGALCRMKK